MSGGWRRSVRERGEDLLGQSVGLVVPGFEGASSSCWPAGTAWSRSLSLKGYRLFHRAKVA